MKKFIKTALYWLVHLTWGLPQTILGAIVYLRCISDTKNKSSQRFTYNCAAVITWKKETSASIGPFLFLSDRMTGDRFKRVLAHEYGHTIQSLITGPLYLIVVGLPSFIWCNHPKFQKMRREKGISYYSVYPEKQADHLGRVDRL